MLFREILAVYSENYMEHLNTLVGRCVFFLFEAVGLILAAP
jgi:hypothetical protein